MRKRLWCMISLTFVFIVTFILGNAIVSFAVDPPGGTYKKTCTHIQVTNYALKADCKTLSGYLNRGATLSSWSCDGTTRSRWQDCEGQIENCNGNLRCTGICLPPGNYRQSSSCCYQKMILGVENVCCLSKRANGIYNSETCTPVSCASPKQIQNIDGTLTCR
jgi:hypothetical protein